jgi:hypothetical protein
MRLFKRCSVDEGLEVELKKLAAEYLNKDISIGRAKLLFLGHVMARFSGGAESDRQAHHDEALKIFQGAFTEFFEDATA